jgi:hypothetical protein
MPWTLVSGQLQSALHSGDQSSATKRMVGRRNKHAVVSGVNEGSTRETWNSRISETWLSLMERGSNRWPQVNPRELNMIGIDSNYFLLPISIDVCFGSPVGELLGSHHPEEEVAQYRVPATLCIQLDRSSGRRKWPDIALQQVVIRAFYHSLLASKLWSDAPRSI